MEGDALLQSLSILHVDADDSKTEIYPSQTESDRMESTKSSRQPLDRRLTRTINFEVVSGRASRICLLPLHDIALIRCLRGFRRHVRSEALKHLQAFLESASRPVLPISWDKHEQSTANMAA